MKFEYNGKDTTKKCVAYIDGDGDLIIDSKNDDHTVGEPVFIRADGRACGNHGYFDESVAVHKFYTGDKITITF